MTKARCWRPEFYTDKIVLAPMVRQSNLPFRLLCLEYGADLVYSEELIDYKLSKCRRLENKILKTIDYVDHHGDCVLRIDPIEKDRLIVQIGSNNFERFIEAARLVAQDVAGVDFNFGCPKKFSISGGMGAAMLEKPEQMRELLTKSVENLDLPITCKIRILPELESTLSLVKMIENCGVSAIAVHGRTKEQRSQGACSDDVLKEISKVLTTIPMIANGGSNDIKSYADILKFKEKTGASSVMLARCAQRNASIFKPDNSLEPIEDVIREYLKLAVRYDTSMSQTKYTIQTMLGSGHFGPEVAEKFHATIDHESLCNMFELTDWYEKNKIRVPKCDYYDKPSTFNEELEKLIEEKRESLREQGEVKKFVIERVPYMAKQYKVVPKAQLIDHINKTHPIKRPQFEVLKLERQKRNEFYCSIIFEDVFYFNKSSSSGKKNAEHTTSILVLRKLGLIPNE